MICARPGCGTVFCDDDSDYPPGVAVTPRRFCSRRCRVLVMRWNGEHERRTREREPWRDLAACRTPWKVGFRAPGDAAAAAEVMRSSRGVALYLYDDCPCGAIHLTRECSPDGSPETLPAGGMTTSARTTRGTGPSPP